MTVCRRKGLQNVNNSRFSEEEFDRACSAGSPPEKWQSGCRQHVWKLFKRCLDDVQKWLIKLMTLRPADETLWKRNASFNKVESSEFLRWNPSRSFLSHSRWYSQCVCVFVGQQRWSSQRNSKPTNFICKGDAQLHSALIYPPFLKHLRHHCWSSNHRMMLWGRRGAIRVLHLAMTSLVSWEKSEFFVHSHVSIISTRLKTWRNTLCPVFPLTTNPLLCVRQELTLKKRLNEALGVIQFSLVQNYTFNWKIQWGTSPLLFSGQDEISSTAPRN